MCLATTADGHRSALERIVGASIVNRFPYVLAISVCRQSLSARHQPRYTFMQLVERSGHAVIQFLAPGASLQCALQTIAAVPERECHARLAATGLGHRVAETCPIPVLEDAYLVYEGKLARPTTDIDGRHIYTRPWVDVGSHRAYFFEITAIQLRRDIAAAEQQIRWRSLPDWTPQTHSHDCSDAPAAVKATGAPCSRKPETSPTKPAFTKPYDANYAFPSSSTVAFDYDAVLNGMAVRFLPPHAGHPVELDNDRARWPCFFPSSAGLITAWAAEGTPNLMPCGSTTVISRQPFVIAPCISYARINQRYSPRATLEMIRRTGRFGCGVPFLHADVIQAIRYAGNVSFADDAQKVTNAGLEIVADDLSPRLTALPIHYDCEVIDEIRLGTHAMFCGQVRRIVIRNDVTPENGIAWRPWADVRPGPIASIEQAVGEAAHA